jgi:hypothetical protein
MRPRTVRRLVWLVFVGGIAGMIVGSIADNNGLAITFGLVTAAAAVGLILVTAVAGPEAFGKPPRRDGAGPPVPESAPAGRRDAASDEDAAERLEQQIAELVVAGADEGQVRDLVRRAVAFGRQSR